MTKPRTPPARGASDRLAKALTGVSEAVWAAVG